MRLKLILLTLSLSMSVLHPRNEEPYGAKELNEIEGLMSDRCKKSVKVLLSHLQSFRQAHTSEELEDRIDARISLLGKYGTCNRITKIFLLSLKAGLHPDIRRKKLILQHAREVLPSRCVWAFVRIYQENETAGMLCFPSNRVIQNARNLTDEEFEEAKEIVRKHGPCKSIVNAYLTTIQKAILEHPETC